MSTGAAIFLELVDVEPDKRARRTVDVDRAGFEPLVQIFERKRSGLTAIVVECSEDEGEAFDLLQATAAGVAIDFRRRTWLLETFANSDWGTAGFAFDKKGHLRWELDWPDEVNQKLLNSIQARLDGAPRRVDGRALPYWRMASEWKSRPRRPLFDLGIEPVLQLQESGWREVMSESLRFSAKHVAATAKARARQLTEASKQEALLHAAREEDLKQQLAAQAARKLAQKAEKAAEAAERRHFESRTLETGTIRKVVLPQGLLRIATSLASKYRTTLAWVLQTAVAKATPWKFPRTALEAVPLTEPDSIDLEVSPSLEAALLKSSITRPDGSVGTFDELVRVALSIGLDELTEHLRR